MNFGSVMLRTRPASPHVPARERRNRSSKERRCTKYTYNFIDGASIRFKAREFDINTGRQTIPGRPKRFSYKDSNGREAPIYLQLDQLAAIIMTPARASDRG